MSDRSVLAAITMILMTAAAIACVYVSESQRLSPDAPPPQSIDCSSGFVVVEKAARGVRVSCATGVNDATVAIHDPHHEIQVLRMEAAP